MMLLISFFYFPTLLVSCHLPTTWRVRDRDVAFNWLTEHAAQNLPDVMQMHADLRKRTVRETQHELQIGTEGLPNHDYGLGVSPA